MGEEDRVILIPRDGEYGPDAAVDAVILRWVCRVCGGPRGEPSLAHGRYHTWSNPCGHADYYHNVRAEGETAPTEAEASDQLTRPAPPSGAPGGPGHPDWNAWVRGELDRAVEAYAASQYFRFEESRPLRFGLADFGPASSRRREAIDEDGWKGEDEW